MLSASYSETDPMRTFPSESGPHETEELRDETILCRWRRNEETGLRYWRVDRFVQRFAVREEPASYGYLAVACGGVCLLGVGLVALVVS